MSSLAEERNEDNGSDEDVRKVGDDKLNGGSFSLEEVKQSPDYERKFADAITKKRKWALNFGYLGSRYQGLQMNPQANTVEKHLERALFLAGSISEHNFGDLHKVQWTRTARTDRGVHAVMQCCAMKLMIPLDGRDLFTKNANSFLPPDIKIHSVTKVTKGFNSKLQCTKRRYHYILPTYILQAKSAIIDELNAAMTVQGKVIDAGIAGGYADPGSDRFLGQEALIQTRAKFQSYRLESARLDTFREALKCYEGTKKYHNFTTGKHPSDPSSTRYILSFACGEPFIDPASGTEWISLSVVGQSFLLNQIRKMIGLACEVASGHAPLSTMTDAVSDKKVEIPTAPGLGLYLDEVFFENYNKCQAKQAAEHGNKYPTHSAVKTPDDGKAGEENDNEPSLAESISWSADPAVSGTMTSFREQVVWPHILQEDATTLEFMYYVDSLRVHPRRYNTSDFGASKQAKKDTNNRQSGGRGGGGGGRGKGGEGRQDRKSDKFKRQKTEHGLSKEGVVPTTTPSVPVETSAVSSSEISVQNSIQNSTGPSVEAP